MKTCFSTLACPDWSLPEIIAAAANYGYDGVELRVVSHVLNLWTLPEFQSSALPATRTLLEDHGLVISSIGTSASFHSPDAEERNRNMDSALRMAEIAADLGARSIRVFGDRVQPGCDRTQTINWIADSLTHLAGRLKATPVEVWLETHGDFAGGADVTEIFAQLQCSQVGIIWDPANAFGQKGEAPLIPPELSSRIRHVHLKDLKRDAQGSYRYMLTGEGDFPFETMFASLVAISFDGFISFEWEKYWHPELDPPEIALPHFIKWFKSKETP